MSAKDKSLYQNDASNSRLEKNQIQCLVLTFAIAALEADLSGSYGFLT